MTVRASRTEVVIDTSALIAVLTAEPARERLIARTQGAELLAPGSVHWETGNALSALLKRRRLKLAEVQAALAAVPHCSRWIPGSDERPTRPASWSWRCKG
jgi:predicted nucleic acid-binding protein